MSSSNTNNHHPPPSADITSHSNPNLQLDPNSGYTPSDNQLAGLVEAATAAAGQDVSPQWAAAVATAAGVAGHHQLDGYSADMHLGDDGFGDANFGAGMGSGRHLRVQNDHAGGSGLSRTVSKKRKRNEDNLDPALAGAGLSGAQHQLSQQSQQAQHAYAGDNIDIRPVPPQSLSEARAVGVHSAAALFRQPSSNKKHTRPPMSKLFASLELSPENFLHLQSAAKGFMLDDEHPERRDCVGQRGKGDTEMVKLRLWNCVRQFLDDEGNGERFFGENVVNEGMGPRTYIWPRDQQKIISLVIPLLRRMVTNERQRQYAIETRKGGGAEERRRRKTNESFSDLTGPRYSPEESLQQMHNQSQSMAPPPPPPPAGQVSQPAMESGQIMDIGLTDLLLDGYTVDWNDMAKSYDLYNQDYELDNLWSLSGLQQPDWRGLVAAVDSHYQVIHHGDYDCPAGCEDENVNRIIHADTTANLSWRIGGARNPPARDELYVLSPNFFVTRKCLANPTIVPAVSLATSRGLSARTSLPDRALSRVLRNKQGLISTSSLNSLSSLFITPNPMLLQIWLPPTQLITLKFTFALTCSSAASASFLASTSKQVNVLMSTRSKRPSSAVITARSPAFLFSKDQRALSSKFETWLPQPAGRSER